MRSVTVVENAEELARRIGLNPVDDVDVARELAEMKSRIIDEQREEFGEEDTTIVLDLKAWGRLLKEVRLASL